LGNDLMMFRHSIDAFFQFKTGEYEKYYNTMNLFAFGTYRQFTENKDKLIPLTPIMDKKLKHLTILTLATQKKTLPYDELMVELDIKNVRHLEDIIIEAIYAGEDEFGKASSPSSFFSLF
jgi:COP9 signalosome complex subunit 7